MNREETRAKYLRALRELHAQLKSGEEVTMIEFVQKHRISHNLSRALRECGLVVHELGRGRGKGYVWIGPPPNKNMVERVLKHIRDLKRTPSERTKKEKNRKKHTPKPTPKPTHYEVRLFWGLVVITATPK